jgi:hypothetical protein
MIAINPNTTLYWPMLIGTATRIGFRVMNPRNCEMTINVAPSMPMRAKTSGGKRLQLLPHT